MSVVKTVINGELFAASNSRYGFKSYYTEIFDKGDYKKVYIIKGGPGTGKSRFMREIAKALESEGHCVRYYACASDPTSLDAVIIDEKTVILDGTPPHSRECRIAGARDEMIDFGVFWDSSRLEKDVELISNLCQKKKESYEKAYKYLSSYGEIVDINLSLARSVLNERKMEKAIDRLLSEYDDGECFSITPALTESVGMSGVISLPTFENSAEKLYYVIDWYSSAGLYLSALISKARKKNMEILVSWNPVNPDFANSVYFCNEKIAFVRVKEDASLSFDAAKINMKRFLDADGISKIKNEFKHNKKLCCELLSSATSSLARAAESHFELERIYSSCMDFSAKEKYTAMFCDKLRGILKS